MRRRFTDTQTVRWYSTHLYIVYIKKGSRHLFMILLFLTCYLFKLIHDIERSDFRYGEFYGDSKTTDLMRSILPLVTLLMLVYC